MYNPNNADIDTYDFYDAIKKERFFGYYPMIDACVFTPYNLKVEQLPIKWTEWYYKEPDRSNEIQDFAKFQHEIINHRLPIVFSSFGTYLAVEQYYTNCRFMDILGNEKSSNHMKFLSDSYEVALLSNSIGITIESLATFREMLLLARLYNKRGEKNYLERAIKLQYNQLKRLSAQKKENRIYLNAYKKALKIYKNLGVKGVQAAVIYALNPIVFVKKSLILKSLTNPYSSLKDLSLRWPDLRFQRVVDLSKQEIPRRLDLDNLSEIIKFFKRKFKWCDPHEARVSAITFVKNKFPAAYRERFPSYDYFSGFKKGRLLPELIFVRKDGKETILSRKRGDEFKALILNFVVTLSQKFSKNILFSRKFIPGYCPLLKFYRSHDRCQFYTNAKNCSVISDFFEQYKIEIEW
jgi:hypothetical protein